MVQRRILAGVGAEGDCTVHIMVPIAYLSLGDRRAVFLQQRLHNERDERRRASRIEELLRLEQPRVREHGHVDAEGEAELRHDGHGGRRAAVRAGWKFTPLADESNSSAGLSRFDLRSALSAAQDWCSRAFEVRMWQVCARRHVAAEEAERRNNYSAATSDERGILLMFL